MVFLREEANMQLQNEKKETVYKYDMDCTDEEAVLLKKIAIERFAKDDHAQIEYAVLSILSETVDKLTAQRLVDGVKSKGKTKKSTKKIV